MTAREWLIDNMGQYDNDADLVKGCVDALGCTRNNAHKRLRMIRKASGVKVEKSPKLAADGNDLAAFRSRYDDDTIIPAKITQALTRLGDAWDYETEFVRRSGVSLMKLASYRDQFAEYWVVTRGDKRRVWAGTKEFAAKLKEYC